MMRIVTWWSPAVLLVAAWGFASSTALAEEPRAPLAPCPWLGYQTNKCEAPKKEEKCDGGPCEPCTADEACTGITAVRESAGAIKGTIDVMKTKVKTKGPKSYKDVVVFLERVGETKFAPPPKHAKLDQKGLVFMPHVLVIQKGTTVDFLNSDNDTHNVYFLFDSTGKTKDLGTWKPGEVRDYQFQIIDTIIMLCKLHLEMAAYLVVLENPFFTIAPIDETTQKGSFTIKNVPPGKYVLRTWHKKLKLKGGGQEVVVENGKTTSLNLTITKAKYAK